MPPLSRVNKGILIAMGASFLMVSALKLAGQPYQFLGLIREKFWGFQLLSYPLVDENIISVIFNGLLFWFLGGELEKQWGEKYYIKFLLSLIFSGAAFFLLMVYSPFSIPFSLYAGTSGVILGLLMAYGIMYGERELYFMFIFPLKAKYFCLLIACIQLYGSFFSLGKLSSLTNLFLMGFAYFMLYFKARQKNQENRKKRFQKHQRESLKKSFRLIKNEEDEKSSGKNPRYWQ